MSTGTPVLKLAKNSYSKGLAFCISTHSYYNGVDFYVPGQSSIVATNDTVPPGITPHFIKFRNKYILGQKFSTSHGSSIELVNPPSLVTSDGNFTGDYTTLYLLDSVSSGTFGRTLHQGSSTATGTANVLVTTNFSGATNSATAGMICIVTYNSGVLSGWADAANTLDGNPHCFVMRRSGGTYTIWRDGKNVTSAQSSTNSSPISLTSSKLCLGALVDYSGENFSPNCTWPLCAGWNRAFTDSEMSQLSNDPFKMFYEPSVPFAFIQGAASGGGAATFIHPAGFLYNIGFSPILNPSS